MPAASPPAGGPAARRAFVLPLTAFLAAHLALSLAGARGFNGDDADLLLFSQDLALGYSDQPPLYTWLSWPVVQLFGPTAAALVVFRTGVLAALAVGLYLCGQLALDDDRRAAAAALAVCLLPTFAWYAVTYLTHTTLACAACVLALYALLRVHRAASWRNYALLGLAVGAGAVSKYNSLLFDAALLLAGLTVPSFRGRLLSRRTLLAVAVAAVVVLPHGLWLAGHWRVVTASVATKTGMAAGGWSVAGVAAGARAVVVNLALAVALLVAAVAACFPQTLRRPPQADDPSADVTRLLGRFFLIAVGLMLLIVLGGARQFHERWLQPFTPLVPLYLFGRLRRSAAPTAAQARRFGYVLATAAGVLTAAQAVRAVTGDLDRGLYPPGSSFAEAAGALAAAGGGPGVTIVAAEREVGGNLRACLPRARCLCRERPLFVPPADHPARVCVVVWNTVLGDRPPWGTAEYVERVLHARLPAAAAVRTTTVRPPQPGRQAPELRYVVVPLAAEMAAGPPRP